MFVLSKQHYSSHRLNIEDKVDHKLLLVKDDIIHCWYFLQFLCI